MQTLEYQRISQTDRIAVPIPEAVAMSGLSRSAIYNELGAGSIQAVKRGVRTLILVDSLRAYLTSLPAATFRPARAA